MNNLEIKQMEVAGQCFESYEFPWPVSDVSGWEKHKTDQFRRKFWLDMTEEGESASLLCVYHVRFEPGSARVKDMFALDLDSGSEIGSPASSIGSNSLS